MFIVACILLVLGLIALAVGFGLYRSSKSHSKSDSNSYYSSTSEFADSYPIALVAGGILTLLAIVAGVISMTYSQDQGEANVVKSISGEVSSIDVDPGFGLKAPWDKLITFDVRNQQAVYKGDGNATAEGEQVNGPEITIQDKDKVSANVDIAIRYSIDPSKLGDIYSNYSSQQELVARKIDQDMRSVTRNAFSKYTTAGVLENRTQLELDIANDLKSRWENSGVVVESIALQGIRYPEATQNGFTQAQESATNLKRAQEDLKVKQAEGEQRKAVAEADAEVKRINAESESQANKTLNESLTDEVLQKQYIDALRDIGDKGNLVVVPEGSQPIVNGKVADK